METITMLNRENTLLHIIDLQEKLLPHIHQHEFILNNISKLIRGMQILEIPMIWMEQYPKGLGPTDHGIKELLHGQIPLEKDSFSSWGNNDFKNRLYESGRKQILVVGIETHICVYQTVSDLIEAGYEIEIVVDGTSSRTPENYQAGIDKMVSLGARKTTTEMALFELLKDSKSDAFKKISRIIK